MQNTLVLAFFLGCVGLAMEVFYTAIYDLKKSYQAATPDWRLQGDSNLWVFFLYASAALLFEPIYTQVIDWPFWGRAALYAALILSVEGLAGVSIRYCIGRCPWHYDSKWSVAGVIRLDYFPFWGACGLLLEQVCLFFLGR